VGTGTEMQRLMEKYQQEHPRPTGFHQELPPALRWLLIILTASVLSVGAFLLLAA